MSLLVDSSVWIDYFNGVPTPETDYRAKGVTIRKTIDCLIATFCIENNLTLLHADRDFDPFEQQLNLLVRHPVPKP